MRIERIMSPQTHASRHHHGEDHGEADGGVQRDVRGIGPRRSSAGPAGAGGVQRSQQGTLALSFRAHYSSNACAQYGWKLKHGWFSLMDREFRRTAFISETEIFCDIINVFIMTLQFNRYSHRIKVILNSTNVSQFYSFCCTLNQINAGLVSRRKSFYYKNCTVQKRLSGSVRVILR